jgi:hypothetical protein
MLNNQVGHQLPVFRKDSYGCQFIVSHQTTIAYDIGTKDGRKLAVNLLFRHGGSYYR